MSKTQAFAAEAYEWRPCQILLPRRALLVDGYGLRRCWISPGRYLTRRSRSLDKIIYRLDGG